MHLQSNTNDIKDVLTAYFDEHPDQAALKEKINGNSLFSGEVLSKENSLRALVVIISQIKAFFEHYIRFFICKGADFFTEAQNDMNQAYSDWNNALYTILSDNKRMYQIVSSFMRRGDTIDFVSYFYVCIKNEMQKNLGKEAVSAQGFSGYKDNTLTMFRVIGRYLKEKGKTVTDAELYNNAELMGKLNIKKTSTYEKLLQEYAAAQNRALSLDEPLLGNDGGSELTLGDFVSDYADDVFVRWEKKHSFEDIKLYFQTMEPVWRRIFIAIYTNDAFLNTVARRYKNFTYAQAVKKYPKGVRSILIELYDLGIFSKDIILHYVKKPEEKLTLESIGRACGKSKQLLSINYNKEKAKLRAYLEEKVR